jgi:hypothetical protein
MATFGTTTEVGVVTGGLAGTMVGTKYTFKKYASK